MEQEKIATQIFAGFGAILYILTAILTVYLFVNSLMNVATSGQDLNDYNSNKKQLNDLQLRFIDSISRYVGLFSIALLTSLVTVTLIALDRWRDAEVDAYGQIISIVANIDTIFNLVCLYLQYQFNLGYYENCVNVWDVLNHILTRNCMKNAEFTMCRIEDDDGSMNDKEVINAKFNTDKKHKIIETTTDIE